jgi:hypothetical protein
MRVGNFFIVLLSLVSITTSKNEFKETTSTLNILELKSSKVLPNFRGEEQVKSNKSNPFKTIYPMEHIVYIKLDLIESDRQWQIRQIDENTFEVLGSPIEW